MSRKSKGADCGEKGPATGTAVIASALEASGRFDFKQAIKWWQRDWLRALLLFIVTMLAYFPAWNGTPVWDDNAHLTKPELRSLEGLGRIWTQPGATQQYYPMAHTLFWVEHRLWGDWSTGYHLLNILLHCASALLLVRILRQLEIPGAWLAAGIFALHPVQVESVAWISELKNLLSGVFYFGSLSAYLKFDRSRNLAFYAAALVIFALGLMSKTVIATLPAVILVIFWWKRGRLSLKDDLLPLMPFFLLGTAAGLFTAWAERTLIGAEGSDFHYSLTERVLIAGRAIWFYLSKFIWPLDLIFIYPRWQISQVAWWQYLFPAAVLALLAILIWLSRRWRAPLAGFLFFIGTLFPVLGFLNVYPFRYSLVADHFQYLACLGIIVLVASGIVLQLKQRQLLHHPIGYGLCGALLASLTALTLHQSTMYTDIETLWQTTIERNPKAWMAHDNLGALLFREGQVNEAIAQYEKAIALRPNYAEIHNNLGIVLFQKGEVDKAIAHYQKALEIDPENVLTRANLAWALATTPQSSVMKAIAVKLAQQANELTGETDPTVLHILAAAFAQRGQFPEAIETAERGLQLATAQSKGSLAEALRTEIGLYQMGLPYRSGK